MKVTKLGSVSEDGKSPTLFDTDRDTYLVQGFRVTDPEALAALEVPGHETVVEIPKTLLGFAPGQAR
jgi:hypothetical protein